MSAHTPQAGDTVYSVDGEMALYVSTAHGGGYIVQPLIEDGDGVSEPESHYADGVAIWPTVYSKPPQPKLDAEIAAQSEKLAALTREVYAMERQKREVSAGMRETKERLQQHAALRYVDDYLAGKFKMFVRFPSYGAPTIEPAAVCLDHDDRYDKGQKLLTLFGDTKGELQWRINRYKDGSGTWSEVFPIADEAEGIAVIRERYTAAVAEWRAQPDDRKHYGVAIAWAELPREWLTPPQDVLDYISSAKAKAFNERAAKLRAELMAVESDIAKATGGAA